MKNFVSPQVEVIEDLCEGVYADSGSTSNNPHDSHPSNGNTSEIHFYSHNTGSHSEGHIYIHNCGQAGHKSYRVHCRSGNANCRLNYITLGSAPMGKPIPTVRKEDDYNFSFDFPCYCNSGENLAFQFYLHGFVPNQKDPGNAIGESSCPSNEYTQAFTIWTEEL